MPFEVKITGLEDELKFKLVKYLTMRFGFNTAQHNTPKFGFDNNNLIIDSDDVGLYRRVKDYLMGWRDACHAISE